ncbi:hypothetical protein Tco_0591903 [Tanacetum coccineum]
MIIAVGLFLLAVITARLLLYFLLSSVFRSVTSSELVTASNNVDTQVAHRITGRNPSILLLPTPRASLSSFSVFRDSEMVESFCNSYYIPDEVHPTAPGRDRTITQFPEAGTSKPVSGSGAGAEVSVLSAEGNVVEANVIPEGAFLDLTDPECDVTAVEKDVAAESKRRKAKRKKLLKRNDPLPAKRLRTDHPSLASGTGGKSLASLRRTLPEGSLILESSSSADVHAHVTVQSFPFPVAGCHREPSEESTDSSDETAILNSKDAKRWYVPRWNITNDSLLDDGFSCRTLVDRVAPPGFFSTLRNMDYDQLFRIFVKENENEFRGGSSFDLRDQVSVLAADKSLLSAEVSALKSTVLQKDTDISLLDSRASYLKSALDDSQAACDEARNLISSLSSERDGLASEVSTLHSAFSDFKEKMEAQQEEQAQELWLLTHGMELAMVKCLKSPEYQGILGHALGRAVDYGMQEDLLSVPIYHADVNAVAGETSLSFALLNVHTRAEGAKKHAAALRQLMVDKSSSSYVLSEHAG